MKLSRFIVVCLTIAVLAGAGCAKKKPEITSLQRKQAELLVSEARFATSLRNWSEADEKLAQAVALCPDTGTYWVSLGTMRMRLGQRDGAKAAYQGALRAYEAEAGKEKAEAEPWLQQVYVLALLGRPNDSRALLEKIVQRFPTHAGVRQFVDRKELDQLLADPKFKENAL